MFTSLELIALAIDAPFDDAIDLARTNGFEGIELPIVELRRLAEKTSLQEVKQRVHAAGLRPGGWGLPLDFRAPLQAYSTALEEVHHWAALARLLGSPWCYTWIYPFSDELDFAANLGFHIERLRPIAQILAEHECRFGLEFIGTKSFRDGHRYEFIHTMDGALDLGERLGTGNTGLLLDSWHWYTSQGTAGAIEQLGADQVVHVHVNDAAADTALDALIDQQRLLPGTSGVIDIRGFLRALSHIGYDGPVMVEPFDARLEALPPEQRVRAAAQSLATIWAQAELH